MRESKGQNKCSCLLIKLFLKVIALLLSICKAPALALIKEFNHRYAKGNRWDVFRTVGAVPLSSVSC